MKINICAIVVWYNPLKEYVDNIRTYYSFVDQVIIIDNSEDSNEDLLLDLPAVEYYWQGENTGIATALNFGMQLAHEKEFIAAITFDQDSKFEKDQAKVFFEVDVKTLFKIPVALLAPKTQSIDDIQPALRESVISSGSLILVSAWKRIGGFNDALFIDQVDHEFCYKLTKHGYKILQSGRAQMDHVVGEPIEYRFFGKLRTSSNHNAQRRYYMARNRLFLRKAYPDIKRPYLRMFFWDAIGIMLVEKNRRKKYAAILIGIKDFLTGRYGRRDLH